MEELLRIEHAYCISGLSDYFLSVYRGDIVYVQSVSNVDLHTLAEVISGNLALSSGSIFLHGELQSGTQLLQSRRSRIYSVTFGREFSENLSVGENMNMNSLETTWHQIYSESRTRERVNRYFRNEQIHLDAGMPMWQVSDSDQKKLGILRAKLFHATLTVIDLTDIVLEGVAFDEIMRMIMRLHGSGMSYLILSPRYSRLAEIATRIQYMHRGKDVREWSGLSDSLRMQLQGQIGFLPIPSVQMSRSPEERRLIGLLDFEWDTNQDFWIYLKELKSRNQEIYTEQIGAMIPEDGVGIGSEMAVIPENSRDMLLGDLTIGENLTIAIPERVCTSRHGVIMRRLQQKMEADFRARFEIDPRTVRVDQLTDLQRKILSVERMILAHPRAVMLENPYVTLELNAIPAFRAYLEQLCSRGFLVFYFARTDEQMEIDCCRVIQTHNGASAKITALSSK